VNEGETGKNPAKYKMKRFTLYTWGLTPQIAGCFQRGFQGIVYALARLVCFV
jgi:hypothetical protein